jgi:stage II sporulation protein P
MFMAFAFWTGYMLLGLNENIWLKQADLLAAGLPMPQTQLSVVPSKNEATASASFMQSFSQAALQVLLGDAVGKSHLPWVGHELIWSQSLDSVRTTAGITNIAEQNNGQGILEEDYTLLEDPYAQQWPEYPIDEIMLMPGGEPRLLVYHTHNSELYTVDANTNKAGKVGVVGAAQALTQTLESKYGIKTAHSEAINDRPDFTKSYLNSFNVVTQFIKKYPNLETVIDLHRDAGMKQREDTLVVIQGRPCAQLLLVMGNAHEDYKGNLAFARKIQAKADELYPGLLKPIRIADKRRYNQQLHPRAILLEVGSDLNYQVDAENSMVLFADVLAQVLEDE